MWRGGEKKKPATTGMVEQVGLNVAAQQTSRTTPAPDTRPLAVDPQASAAPPEVIRPSGRVRLTQS
jgi:hypothetical protein